MTSLRSINRYDNWSMSPSALIAMSIGLKLYSSTQEYNQKYIRQQAITDDRKEEKNTNADIFVVSALRISS